MGFTPKSDKPFPPVTKGLQRQWAGKYFNYVQGEGEQHSTELKKLVEMHGMGHPQWVAPVKSEAVKEPIVSHETKEEKTFTFTEAELNEKLRDMEARILQRLPNMQKGDDRGDIKDIIADLADSINPTAGLRPRAKFEANIDPTDYLDKPVRFFTYRNYFSIHSETRYSHEVKTPYGRPIIFKNISGHVTGGHKGGKQTVQIAAVDIYTKKELDWMKKSPMFNIIFFAKAEGVDTTDPHKAAHLAQALSEVSGLTEYGVMQKAIAAGISPSTDVEDMRKQLINLLAGQNMEIQKSISRSAASSIEDTYEDTLKRGINKNQVSGVTMNSY